MQKYLLSCFSLFVLITIGFFSEAAVIEKHYPEAQNFTTLSIAGRSHVFVTLGKDFSVKVKAEEDVINNLNIKVVKEYNYNNLNVEVEEDVLEIEDKQTEWISIQGKEVSHKRCIGKLICDRHSCLCTEEVIKVSRSELAKIYITAPAITSFKARDGAKLTINKMIAESIDLKASDGSTIVVPELQVKDLNLSVSSGSLVTLSGDANKMMLEAYKGGNTDAAKLDVEDAVIWLTSGSSAHAHVEKNLKAYVAQGSKLYYAGNASVTENVVASGGQVLLEKWQNIIDLKNVCKLFCPTI